LVIVGAAFLLFLREYGVIIFIFVTTLQCSCERLDEAYGFQAFRHEV
jgi:hypothetical protein